MVIRIWRGWTTRERADTYETLLRQEILPGIAAKHIDGYRRVDVLRLEHGDETEFTTMMWFDSLDSIKAFTGDDYQRAYVPESARAVLSRFDERARHHEVRERIDYGSADSNG